MKLKEMQERVSMLHRRAFNGCTNHGCVIAPSSRLIGTNSTCTCTPFSFSEELLNLAADMSPKNRYSKWDAEDAK